MRKNEESCIVNLEKRKGSEMKCNGVEIGFGFRRK